MFKELEKRVMSHLFETLLILIKDGIIHFLHIHLYSGVLLHSFFIRAEYIVTTLINERSQLVGGLPLAKFLLIGLIL